MKAIGIFYFSGTGNTQKVSQMVKNQFESHSVLTELHSIEELLKTEESINLSNYDMVGLAYPIHGYGTPSIVQDFVKLLPPGKGLKLFIFKTAADYIILNNNASSKVIKKLEVKGYMVFYDRIILMPSNWILEFNNVFIKQITLEAKVKVVHMCNEILNLKRRRNNINFFVRFITSFIAFMEEKYGSKYFGKSLHTTNSCNLCGICIKKCPVCNITKIEDKLIFKDKCLWCMRCIYTCPKKAIKSKGFSFCILNNGYNLEKVIKDDTIGDEFVTTETKGFYKRFYRYIYDESL